MTLILVKAGKELEIVRQSGAVRVRTGGPGLRGLAGAKGDDGPQGEEGPTGDGSGNVLGPVSSVDGNVMVADGTTGTKIKDGGFAYSSGTWTPTLTFGGASTGITYTDQTGTYLKIGKLVCVSGRLAISSKGTATGLSLIGGLPFAPSGNGGGSVGLALGFTGLSGALVIWSRATGLSPLQAFATGYGGISDPAFTDTASIVFSATYQTS